MIRDELGPICLLNLLWGVGDVFEADRRKENSVLIDS